MIRKKKLLAAIHKKRTACVYLFFCALLHIKLDSDWIGFGSYLKKLESRPICHLVSDSVWSFLIETRTYAGKYYTYLNKKNCYSFFDNKMNIFRHIFDLTKRETFFKRNLCNRSEIIRNFFQIFIKNELCLPRTLVNWIT